MTRSLGCYPSVCLVVVGLLLQPVGGKLSAQTPRDESSWAPLTDEPSRADLFREDILRLRQSPHGGVVAIPKVFIFPLDVKVDNIQKKPRPPSIFGIDISHYTPESIDFAQLSAQGAAFVYAKATQGTGAKDEHFGNFWARLEPLQAERILRRGAYHFLSADPGSSGRDQADSFVDYVNLHGGFKPDDLPPVVDLEWDRTKHVADRWVGHDQKEIESKVLDCLRRIEERTGRRPILYTATSWWTKNTLPLARFPAFREFRVWIADYMPGHKLAEKPAVPAGTTQILWQFTDRARFKAGYDEGIDASIFYGTRDQFDAAFVQPK